MPVVLAYWALRGLAEPSRLLLKYAAHSDSDWTNKAIPLTAEGFGSWFGVKQDMGMDFPNLPYVIDGDIKVTQSIAVLRYLGRKYGLWPDEADMAKADMLEQVVNSLKLDLTTLVFSPTYDNEVEKFKESLPGKLAEVGKFIGEGPHALGDKITYVDFLTYEYLDHFRVFSPDQFKEGALADYLTRFEEIPQMKEWFASEERSGDSYYKCYPEQLPGRVINFPKH